MKSLTLLFVALAAATPYTASKKNDGPTVYMCRHGEKPADDDAVGLSAVGQARARCFRDVFGAQSQFKIGKFMAQAFKADGSRMRPFLTQDQVAADAGLQIDFSCDRDDPKCVRKAIEDFDGDGNILITWEHDALTDIAKELGVDDAPDYPSDSFDLIWTIPPPYDTIVSITSENCPGLDY